MAASRWFALRYGAFSKHLLNLFASGPARSGIALNDADLAIVMGWSFNARAPRATVMSARAVTDRVVSRGVHGWRGDWLVNAAGDGLVELVFDPPMRARVVAFPVRVSRLRIAVVDPDGFVEALAAHPDG